MTMHTALTMTSLIAGLAYIALFATAVFIGRSGATLRQLTHAVRLYGWAVAAEGVVLIVRLISGEYGWAALAVLTGGIALYCLGEARKRRSRKALQVQIDAERTVQDWRGDQW